MDPSTHPQPRTQATQQTAQQPLAQPPQLQQPNLSQQYHHANHHPQQHQHHSPQQSQAQPQQQLQQHQPQQSSNQQPIQHQPSSKHQHQSQPKIPHQHSQQQQHQHQHQHQHPHQHLHQHQHQHHSHQSAQGAAHGISYDQTRIIAYPGYPTYAYTYPEYQAIWPGPHNYMNMVNPQSQTNVPQQPNKNSNQPLSPAMSTGGNLPNQARATEKKARRVATLKDPKTGKEVDLSTVNAPKGKPEATSTTSTQLSNSSDGASNDPSSTTKAESPPKTPKKGASMTTAQMFLKSVTDRLEPASKEETDAAEVSEEKSDSPTSVGASIPSSDGLVNGKTLASDEENKNESVKEVEKPQENVTINNKENQDTTDNQVDSKKDSDEVKQDSNGNEDREEPLKYDSEDQYNPFKNRTGKKIYSMEFLKRLGDKLFPPTDNLTGEKIDLFHPDFFGTGQTNRHNDSGRHNNYSGRNSAGQEKPRKIITSVSLNQEVELKTTSNPWRPTKDLKDDNVSSEAAETEILKKKFRSILNKLTPDNFDSLSNSVTDLHIDTESKLGEVIDIVFAKALAEPGYCELYGKMCSHLRKNTIEGTTFFNTLLRRCQNQFFSSTYSGIDVEGRRKKIEEEKDPDVKKQLDEELYEDMFRCRKRSLGLVKFIGELYKLDMLNNHIMFECIHRLLGDISEESLECLCDLLTTIGEKLDKLSQKGNEKDKKNNKGSSKVQTARTMANVVAAIPSSEQKQQSLDEVFEKLQKIRKNNDNSLSARIRFKILDTYELREKYNWRCKKTKDAGLKKLDEIREAHTKEKQEQDKRQQSVMGPRRSQEGNRRTLGHSGGSSSQISSMTGDGAGQRGQSGLHTSNSSHQLIEGNSNINEMNHKNFKKDISKLINSLGDNRLSESLRPNLQLRPPSFRSSGPPPPKSTTPTPLAPVTTASKQSELKSAATKS